MLQKIPKILYKTSIILCVSVFIVYGLYLYSPSSITKVKDFFSGSYTQEKLQSLGKEISNSGKLILKNGIARSHLTYTGTFSFTNAERSKAGLKIFTSNNVLNAVAQRRVNDMFAKQYFEHVSPTGDSASSEADEVGYTYISIGENIALGNFSDDEALVLAWMNSPGHRANILNTKFQELGVAVGKGMYEGKETWIAVQVFGKPLSACPGTNQALKAQIDRHESTVAENQRTLDNLKRELDRMRTDERSDRSEYNQKVDIYNTLVSETNSLVETVKSEIAQYNVTVRAFNTCLEAD